MMISRVNYNWAQEEGIRYRREIMKPKGRFRGVQQEEKKGIGGHIDGYTFLYV